MSLRFKAARRVACVFFSCLIAAAVSAAPVEDRAAAPKTLPPPAAPMLPEAGPAACAPDLPPAPEQAGEARKQAAPKTPLRQNAPDYRMAKSAGADSARFQYKNEPRWTKDMAIVGGALSAAGLLGLIVFASLWATGAALVFLLLLNIGVGLLTVGWVSALFARAKRRREAGESDQDYYYSLTGIFLLGLLGSAIAGFLALLGASYVVFSMLLAAFGVAAVFGGVFLLTGFLVLLAISAAAAAVCFFGALVSLIENLSAKGHDGNAEI